ncbi:MAG: GNAT family N-acetyltransferase [Mycobacterium leprae]
MLQIRPATRDDSPAIVAIRNAIQPEPLTVTEFVQLQEAFWQYPGAKRQLLVAEADGPVVGYTVISRIDDDPAGLFHVYVAVDPTVRRRGLGLQLYTALLGLAEQYEAVTLKSHVRGTDDESYAWALARGFHLDRQRTEAVLDLKSWDGAPFAGEVARVEAGGIRLVCTHDFPTASLMPEIYRVWKETAVDLPGWEGEFGTYEAWAADFSSGYGEHPPIMGLALDGERLVGMSILGMPRTEGAGAIIDYTGVLREFRGRGIAMATKLLTIEAAAAAGAPYIRTNNDPDNPPMLAVNRRLGFAFIPGPRVLKKNLR